MPKPLWLLNMSAKSKARWIAKVHAIILLDLAEVDSTDNCRVLADMLWSAKSHYEGEAKK